MSWELLLQICILVVLVGTVVNAWISKWARAKVLSSTGRRMEMDRWKEPGA